MDKVGSVNRNHSKNAGKIIALRKIILILQTFDCANR